MKRTNEMIFAEIRERGFMTEQEMKLIKNRSNKEQKDLFDYNLVEEFDGYGVPIDEEWANKAIKWLKSLINANGEPKKGFENICYREAEIIKSAEPDDFRFVCFYDNGNRYFSNYIPVYNLAGMEYRVESGKIVVVG